MTCAHRSAARVGNHSRQCQHHQSVLGCLWVVKRASRSVMFMHVQGSTSLTEHEYPLQLAALACSTVYPPTSADLVAGLLSHIPAMSQCFRQLRTYVPCDVVRRLPFHHIDCTYYATCKYMGVWHVCLKPTLSMRCPVSGECAARRN